MYGHGAGYHQRCFDLHGREHNNTPKAMFVPSVFRLWQPADHAANYLLLIASNPTGEFHRNILLSMAKLEENDEADHSSLKTLEDLISFNQLYNWPNVGAQHWQPSRVCFALIELPGVRNSNVDYCT